MDANERTKARFDILREFGCYFWRTRTDVNYACKSPDGWPVALERVNDPSHIRKVVDKAWEHARKNGLVGSDEQ